MHGNDAVSKGINVLPKKKFCSKYFLTVHNILILDELYSVSVKHKKKTFHCSQKLPQTPENINITQSLASHADDRIISIDSFWEHENIGTYRHY